MCNFAANTAPADGLAILEAMKSAGKVMTNFESHMYIDPALKGLILTFMEYKKLFVMYIANMIWLLMIW